MSLRIFVIYSTPKLRTVPRFYLMTHREQWERHGDKYSRVSNRADSPLQRHYNFKLDKALAPSVSFY